MNSDTPKISALLITLNEIEHIRPVLENLSFADEIVVVDSFSQDGTAEAAREFKGTRVFQREFLSFTDQKSFALAQARHDWILFTDADERITDALREEILQKVRDPDPDIAAYFFRRTFIFEGKVLKFSGWQSDKNFRLFKKSKCRFDPSRIVHETLIVEGKTAVLRNKLIHYSYASYQEYKSKMILYGKMKAVEEWRKGKRFYWTAMLFRPLYKFVNHYLLRLGILDGRKGLVISYLNALGVYTRYQELRRLNKVGGQE